MIEKFFAEPRMNVLVQYLWGFMFLIAWPACSWYMQYKWQKWEDMYGEVLLNPHDVEELGKARDTGLMHLILIALFLTLALWGKSPWVMWIPVVAAIACYLFWGVRALQRVHEVRARILVR